MSKRAGRHSQQSNDFLEPLAPENVSATDVGTGRAWNNGAASVSFSLPAGSPEATSYTVTASTGQSATGSSSPIVVEGLVAGNTPKFSVTATNAAGTSAASAETAGVAITTVPDTVTGVAGSSPYGANYDTVTWNTPSNGGKAITNYYVVGNDGTSGNTSSNSINITQNNGETQEYTVYADNGNGRSGQSSPAVQVTTFSFVPFSVFSFFGVFGFVPFNVFGFVPFFSFFSVFGFVPFKVFSFAPFKVFSFAPFKVFGFR